MVVFEYIRNYSLLIHNPYRGIKAPPSIGQGPIWKLLPLRVCLSTVHDLCLVHTAHRLFFALVVDRTLPAQEMCGNRGVVEIRAGSSWVLPRRTWSTLVQHMPRLTSNSLHFVSGVCQPHTATLSSEEEETLSEMVPSEATCISS